MTVEHGVQHGPIGAEKTAERSRHRLSALPLTDQEKSARYPMATMDLNAAIYGSVTDADAELIGKVERTDWLNRHLNMNSEPVRKNAGKLIAAGAAGFVEFGNFKALVFNPHEESMRSVNVNKGRKPDQVASLVTTREHIESIFDWNELERGMTKDDVTRMMDAFYTKSEENPHVDFAGPFGFRGPAADHIPDHLTEIDPKTGKRLVQIILPNYECPSNDVVGAAITAMKDRDPDMPNYLAITSANPSSTKTGRQEPAHWLRGGLQEEFHNYSPRFFIMGHETQDKELEEQAKYENHATNSTTILDFSRAEVDEFGMVGIHMVRHGSLSDEHTEMMLASLGMTLHIDDNAPAASELRQYSTEFIDARKGTPETVHVEEAPSLENVVFINKVVNS